MIPKLPQRYMFIPIDFEPLIMKRRHICILFLLLLSGVSLKVGAAEGNGGYSRFQELYGEGKYDEAIKFLNGYVETLPYSMRAVPLSDIGTCHSRMGNIWEANRAFEEALKYAGTASQRDNILLSYSNNLIEGGGYERALECLENITGTRALPHKLINKSHAAYYLGRSSPEQCVALLDSCLSLEGVDAGLRFVALQNKAFILYETGLYQQAAEVFDAALPLSPDSLAYYRTLANFALSESRLGRMENTLKHINTAESWFKPQKNADYAICLRKKGEILSRIGLKEQAVRCFKEYFNLERDIIAQRLDGMTRQERLNLWLKEKPMLSKCFILEDFAPEFLYEVALFRRQTSLLGASDTDNSRRKLAMTPLSVRKAMKGSGDVAVEFVTYPDSDRQTQYAAIVLPKRGDAKFVKLFSEAFLKETTLTSGKSIYDAIMSERREDKDALYGDTLIADAIWAPIFQAMPRETRRLFFAPEGIINFWGIENMPFSNESHPELHRVTSTLSLTELPVKSAGKGALLIGGLNYYTLPDDTDGAEPSREAAEILRLRGGDAIKFEYLPGTRAEVDSIHDLLVGSDLWHEAGEHNLKQKMPEYGLVHVATHGYALTMGIRPRPELSADSSIHDVSLYASGLALTGANKALTVAKGEDGLLSAREICDMDLSQVDFVILSACQTAQGNIVDEGAAGLVRGLKNAGVPAVLATLWAVNDKSTMLFMQEFHRLLNNGRTKYEAYTGAQRALRQYNAEETYYKFSPRTLAREKAAEPRIIKYDAPYYWAPFILIDDAIR